MAGKNSMLINGVSTPYNRQTPKPLRSLKICTVKSNHL